LAEKLNNICVKAQRDLHFCGLNFRTTAALAQSFGQSGENFGKGLGLFEVGLGPLRTILDGIPVRLGEAVTLFEASAFNGRHRTNSSAGRMLMMDSPSLPTKAKTTATTPFSKRPIA
jgi:hypothetical protein